MSDRKTLIRLASTLPKGSNERKAILVGLKKTAAPNYKVNVDDGRAFLKDPGQCPYCGSTNLDAHAFEAEDEEAWRVVECENCEARWGETFEITEVEWKQGPRVDVEDLDQPPTKDSIMERDL